MSVKETNNSVHNGVAIKRVSIVDQVTRLIQDSIANGEILMGSKILLTELSKKLGVSVTPLREAIRKIEADRVVESSHGQGFVVRIPSVNEIHEIFVVRKRLEIMAYKLACCYIKDEEIQKIEKTQADIKTTIYKYNPSSQSDLKLFIQLNKNFHYSIFYASRNKILLETISTLWRKSAPLIAGIIYTKKKLAKLEREHDDILEALKKKDKRKIQKVVNEHLNTTENMAMQYVKRLEANL